MRYITIADAEANRVRLDVGNIHHTGSIEGMRNLYGWKPNEQVRVGSYIYNIGAVEMARCIALRIVRGITY